MTVAQECLDATSNNRLLAKTVYTTTQNLSAAVDKLSHSAAPGERRARGPISFGRKGVR